jgi:hypothetical protein
MVTVFSLKQWNLPEWHSSCRLLQIRLRFCYLCAVVLSGTFTCVHPAMQSQVIYYIQGISSLFLKH